MSALNEGGIHGDAIDTGKISMYAVTDPATNAATTSTIIGVYGGAIITTTTTGNSQTLASPTDTTAGKIFVIVNNDTSTNTIPVVANSVTYTIGIGVGQAFIWDGTNWMPTDSGAADITANTLVGWRSVTGFTAAPNSTSTLTVPDITSWAKVGLPIKFAIGETTYYAQITALTSSLMTIAGAPFGGNVTSLAVGDSSHIVEMNVLVPGNYEASSSNTVLLTTNKQSLIWYKPEAALVKYTVFSNTADGSGDGKATVYVNGNETNTSAGGLTIANAQTTYSTVVDIDAGNYTITYGQPLEISVTKGTGGDAADLTVHMLFVIK